MKEGETQLTDQKGKFAQVVNDGRKVPDIEWVPGRILLSNKRLILASKQGKRMIPLPKLSSIKSREDAENPLAKVSSYISLQVDSDVTLISPQHHQQFEQILYNAVLDQQVIAVKHPAVKGGVVQNTGWEKARLVPELEEETISLAMTSGQFVQVELNDVGMVEENEGDVLGDERFFIEVEHTQEKAAVQTYISGPKQKVTILKELLRKNEQQNEVDVELTEEENEVLMALYSGVSPFQIPEFVGMEIETVEAIYDDLIDAGILQEQRVRRDVQLKARGRNIASEAMDEE
ncbi:CheF family chemotaxis protein [Halovenus rubra]|uniref:Taxis protein CheF n=2 Tax=Halovenus rubra TaxID=869890 RepID=A0ABD5XDU0_9EURY|nr:CheF family chemotaxis protein [Halovenus rubra]